jgi:hypothetical protein
MIPKLSLSMNDQGLAKLTLCSNSWPLSALTPGKGRERPSPPSAPALTRVGMSHWPHMDRGDNDHLSSVRRHPCTTQQRQDNIIKRWRQVQRTTVQIWPGKTYVRSHPLWDGIHDSGFDLEVVQANAGHDLRAQDRGHQLHKQQNDQWPSSS